MPYSFTYKGAKVDELTDSELQEAFEYIEKALENASVDCWEYIQQLRQAKKEIEECTEVLYTFNKLCGGVAT